MCKSQRLVAVRERGRVNMMNEQSQSAEISIISKMNVKA
jgi:hypothetical protein